MANFEASSYKKQLELSQSCESCEKVPVPTLKEDGRYIFISYSHKDYKKVYADLADLYEKGIIFRYDSDLIAGLKWDEEVGMWLKDPRCVGTIFYLSENLLLSKSVEKEIDIVYGEDSQDDTDDASDTPEIGFFCVNLTDKKPSELIKSAYQQARANHTDAPDISFRFRKKLERMFPDDVTFRAFYESDHIDQLIRDIHTNFHMDPNYNLYSFGDTQLHGGNAVIEFKNHAIYDGSLKSSLFEGFGTMSYSANEEYTGNWFNGKKHGHGTMKYANGNIYTGEWAADQRHGKGTLTKPDGRTYTGEWVEDKLCGPGIMKAINGTTYVGEWVNSKRHGKGTKTWANGKIYTGSWVDGKRQGWGTMKYSDSWSYIGEWRNSREHGYGTMTWSKDKVYTGQWVDGKQHGQGTLQEKGCEYSGEWIDGREHGHGKKIWATKEYYTGEWANGYRHGQGKMIWPDGQIYTGQWTDGKRHGYGTMTYPDGRIESGEWVKGKLRK